MPKEPLTFDDVYAMAIAVGFPPVVATTITAITKRESYHVPDVLNDNPKTGDKSYGLAQINMANARVAAVVRTKVLQGQPDTALFDPLTNLKAAFILYGGNVDNLNVAWYINRGPEEGSKYDYKGQYVKWLPEAQAAALRYARSI